MRGMASSLVVFMLHSGCKRDHSQVVRIDDVVDVAGQSQRERGKRNALGQSAARCASLDIHGRSAGGLPDRAGNFLSAFSQALNQAHGGSALAFSEWSRAVVLF